MLGAGRFGSGKRNLLGKIRGGNDFFRERDTVIRHENDFQPVRNLGVAVDDLAHGIDELDDEFCHVISGRSLGAEKNRARNNIGTRIVLDVKIQGNGVEGIQELAFVLMQTLDLNIENRIHIHFHAADILQISGKPFLIGSV